MLAKCANGHFYDTDKFEACPYCIAMSSRYSDVTEPVNPGFNTPTSPLTTDLETEKKLAAEAVDIPDLKNDISNSKEKDISDIMPDFYPDSGDKTTSYYSNLIGSDPVVGWLVCVKGEFFGDSFKLKSGRNFIGRGNNMDVVLSMDLKVSRDRHCIVIYEPRSRKFIAQPGDSRELFYLNDEVVLSNETMKAYDVLSIGDTKLMLVPCCGENFCWEDVYEKKEDK